MNGEAAGIVDAHVHIYPVEVASDPAAWASSRGEPKWGALATPAAGRRVRQGWADCDRLLRDMDAAGVERSILLGWYWERQETCEWHNRYYAACIRDHPDRLLAFATVQAGAGEAALREMEWAADNGFIGLGELCPRAVGGTLLDSGWLAVFQRAAAWGWPVNLHLTDPAGRPYEGRVETPLDECVALAAQIPELRLILAHWGGGLFFHEASPYCGRALANAVYDTAATPLLYGRDIYRRAVSLIGPERILFGSDYPLLVFPAEQAEPDLHRVLDDVRSSGIGAAATAAVLGGNTERMLKKTSRPAGGS